jgi:hypothetical protein
MTTRYCQICGGKLSRYNPQMVCYCHPQHPEYSGRPLPIPRGIGTNIMNHITHEDDTDGLSSQWSMIVESETDGRL